MKTKIITLIAAACLTVGVYLWRKALPLVRSERPNIVYIVADALRADHLSLYGYKRKTSPFLDDLATRAVVFQSVKSTCSWTLPAMVSQFTSHTPVRFYKKGQPISDELVFITEILKEHGYHTYGISANPHLGEHENFLQGFDEFIYITSLDGWYLNRDFEDKILPKLQKPFFLWLHYMDVHTPYSPPPRFTKRINEDLVGAGVHMDNVEQTELDQEQMQRAIDLYDAEILYWDWLVKRVYDILGADPSILWVITSDHGEALGDHGSSGHGISVYEEQLHIPLILYSRRLPQEETVVPEPISSIDILPTLLKLSGIDATSVGLEGKDAFEREGPFVAYATSNAFLTSQVAIYREKWKYIYDYGNGRQTLFDLSLDAEEERNRFDEYPGVAASLAKELQSYLEANADKFPPSKTEAPELDPQVIETLKTLGYVK